MGAVKAGVEIAKSPGRGVIPVQNPATGSTQCPTFLAVGLKIDDGKDMTAKLVSRHVHSPALLANFEGDFQQLPNHDDFLGWGEQPYFSEYNQRGQLVFDGHAVGPNSSYRDYRFYWSATPSVPPAIRGRGTPAISSAATMAGRSGKADRYPSAPVRTTRMTANRSGVRVSRSA